MKFLQSEFWDLDDEIEWMFENIKIKKNFQPWDFWQIHESLTMIFGFTQAKQCAIEGFRIDTKLV